MKNYSALFLLLFSVVANAQTGIKTRNWKLTGIGNIEMDKNALKITEGNNSKGVVLLSSKKYSKNLRISFDIKPLKANGVCVIFFCATSLDGSNIKISENYDGNSDFWISEKSGLKSYAIAFHTSFHQPNILIKKNPGWKSLAEIKDVVTEEKWYTIVIERKNNIIILKVNGNTVLQGEDKSDDQLGKGQIGLRLRGPGDGSFSVLYKNLSITRIK